MVKTEDLKFLAQNFGIDIMSDFISFQFLKTLYKPETKEYYIKRILINSLLDEKNKTEFYASSIIPNTFNKDLYYFYLSTVLNKHFSSQNVPNFLDKIDELLLKKDDFIAIYPKFIEFKNNWWIKLFLSDNKINVFGKVFENGTDFYLLTNKPNKNAGDISLIVLEISSALPEQYLRQALIGKDIKVKEIIDYMPTNSGKILYLLEVDGVIKDKSPLLSLSFDFEGVLINIRQKLGSYYTQDME